MSELPLVTFNQLKRKYKQISPNKYSFSPLFPSPELAEFIGMTITEGTITEKGAILFVNTDEFLIDRYCYLMEKLFNRKIVTIKEWSGFKHKKKCVVTRIMSTALLKVLKEIGLPTGRRSLKDYKLPLFISNPERYNISKERGKEIQRLFLRTIYSCDGSKPFTNLSRTSGGHRFWIRYEITKNEKLLDSGKEFLNQIRGLLLNFDIETTKVYRYKNRVFFNITKKKSILNFYKNIGYSIEYKQNELKYVVDFIRNFKTLVELKRERILEFLATPHTTKEVRDFIHLHLSKTYRHLIYLENKGLVKRIKGKHLRKYNSPHLNGRSSIWIRRW